MTPEQIQKMADGAPPSIIGKDCEEVITWLAKHHIELQYYEGVISDGNKRIAELERERDAMEAVALAMRDDMRQARDTHSWINELEIPESAMTASYDPGAGPIICAVAEVDEELQADGYPVLCWAYLDVVPGMMIDRATNSNITSHVVRWLPVARVNNDD